MAIEVLLPADVQQVDETGFVWAYRDTALDPARVQVGHTIVAGDPLEPFLAQVVDIVEEDTGDVVHLKVVGVPSIEDYYST